MKQRCNPSVLKVEIGRASEREREGGGGESIHAKQALSRIVPSMGGATCGEEVTLDTRICTLLISV